MSNETGLSCEVLINGLLHVNGNMGDREGAQGSAILVKDFLGQRSKEPGEVYGCESQPPSPLMDLGDRPVILITYSYLARLVKLQSRHDNGAKRRGESGLGSGVYGRLGKLVT